MNDFTIGYCGDYFHLNTNINSLSDVFKLHFLVNRQCVDLLFFLKANSLLILTFSPALRSNLFARRGAKRISTPIRFRERGFVLSKQVVQIGLI